MNESNEMSRTQAAVEDLILQQVDFDSTNTKGVQMTQLLRDMGMRNPRVADFKEAARVLHKLGIEPRRSNGKKIYDLDYEPIEDREIQAGNRWGD